MWIALGMCAWIVLCVWYTFLSNVRGQTHGFFWFGNICEFFFCIGLFAFSLLFSYNRIIGKILEVIGGNTNGVYLLHVTILPWLVNPFNHETIMGRFAWFIIILFLSLIMAIALGKVPVVKRIVNI